MTFILKELARADRVCVLKYAPATSEIGQHGSANTVSDGVTALQQLIQESSINSDYKSAY